VATLADSLQLELRMLLEPKLAGLGGIASMVSELWGHQCSTYPGDTQFSCPTSIQGRSYTTISTIHEVLLPDKYVVHG
jgi:hypothetical protein